MGAIFDQFAIFETEGRRKVTVNVEFAGHLAAHEDRDDDLRLGFDGTRQVARIAPDVVYDDSLSRRRSCTADSLIERNASVRCHRSLKVPKHQHGWLGAWLQHIKADPVVLQHFVEQQPRDVLH